MFRICICFPASIMKASFEKLRGREGLYSFHATGFSLIPLKISENLYFLIFSGGVERDQSGIKWLKEHDLLLHKYI